MQNGRDRRREGGLVFRYSSLRRPRQSRSNNCHRPNNCDRVPYCLPSAHNGTVGREDRRQASPSAVRRWGQTTHGRSELPNAPLPALLLVVFSCLIYWKMQFECHKCFMSFRNFVPVVHAFFCRLARFSIFLNYFLLHWRW